MEIDGKSVFKKITTFRLTRLSIVFFIGHPTFSDLEAEMTRRAGVINDNSFLEIQMTGTSPSKFYQLRNSRKF